MSEVIIRPVAEQDVESIIGLYRDVYGDAFPFQEFYDANWIKRGIFHDDIVWYVAERAGRLLGSAAAMLNAGDSDDLIAEIGRLVVHPDARGLGVGGKLVETLTDRVEETSDFAFGECRTAHVGAQKILTRDGYAVTGVEPLAYDIGGVRESVVFVVRLLGNATRLRRNNPRVIPAVHAVGALAMQACGLESDLLLDTGVDPYPVRLDEYQLGPLDNRQVYRLLRLSGRNLRDPEIFGGMRLEYGFLKLKKYDAQYLVLRKDNVIVGGLGYVWDDLDSKIRIFELVATDEFSTGTLLEAALREIEKRHDPAYIQVDVGAHATRMQQTLHLLGFAAVAYCPAMVYHVGERLDVVKMVKLRVSPDFSAINLLPISQQAFDVVLKDIERTCHGVEVDAVTRRVPLFSGLNEVQLARVVSISREVQLAAGAEVFAQGDEGRSLFVVINGEVEVVHDGERVALLGPGESVGEMALVEHRPRTAGVRCTEDTRLLALDFAPLEGLMKRDPAVGFVLMANLAMRLSERLRRSSL